MKTKLLLISIIFVLALSITGCKGAIPTPQEAIEETVKTPRIDLCISVDGLSSSGLNVAVQASISNPNPVALDIGDLEVIAKGETGRIYLHDTIMGGSIAANSSRTFTHDIVIPVDVLNERTSVITANTRAGAGGITLPTGATVTITTPKLASLVSVPQPHVCVSTPSLRLPPAPPSVKVPTKTIITNDNSVGLILGDLHINLYKSGGRLVKTDAIPGGTIPAHGTRTFEHSIILGLELLNIIGSSSVTVEVNTEVGISGINEMLPIEGQFTLELPPFPPWF